MEHQTHPQQTKLQQTVRSFFTDYSPAEVEEFLYNIVQAGMENDPPHVCRQNLHMYRQLTLFVTRLKQLS